MPDLRTTRRAAVLGSLVVAATACSGGGGGDTSSGGSGNTAPGGGSGNTAPGGGGAGGGAANPEGTLRFANWQWLEPGRGDKILAAVKKYEAKNPKAKVEKVDITRADYEKTIATQIGGGAGPDIFIVPDPFFPELASSGAMEPLDDVAKAARDLRKGNENYKYDGQQLSILWEAVPYALFWNKKLVEQAGVKPPTTVDELAAAAKAIKDKTGKTGFSVRHQMNEESPWWTDYSNWAFGFGGTWSKDKKLILNSPENVAAAEAFQKVYKSGGFGVGDDASTYRSKFAAREIGMCIDNSSAALTIVSKANGLQPDELGAGVLPFPKGGSAYAGFSVGVNAKSKNKALAKDFLTWMLAGEQQTAMADALFPSGIATSAKPSAEMLQKHAWVEPFYKQLDNSSSVVVKDFEESTPQIRTIVLTEVVRMLTQGVSPKEAMDAAQQKASSIKPKR